MKVKVGDQWYEATADQPIMVVLTEQDRRNIAGMPPDYRRYACFAEDDPRDKAKKFAWMNEG